MGWTMEAYLLKWNTAIKKCKAGTFNSERIEAQQRIQRDGKYLLVYDCDWLYTPRDCVWQNNGHLYDYVSQALSDTFQFVPEPSQSNWRKLFHLIFPALDRAQPPAIDFSFAEEGVLFSLSPSHVVEWNEKFIKLDFTKLEPFYEKAREEVSLFPREFLDEWGGFEGGFLSYLNQWQQALCEAAKSRKGLFVQYYA